VSISDVVSEISLGLTKYGMNECMIKETVGVGKNVMMGLLFAALPTLAGSTVPARNACETCKQRERA
jgi:hypothetical protein